MSKTDKVLITILGIFLVGLVIFVVVASNVPEKSPDIVGELNALLYSSSGLNSNDCYVIFAGEKQKPTKAAIDSVTFKFDPQVEKPTVKIWIEENNIAKKAEIYFRDKEQMREYLK